MNPGPPVCKTGAITPTLQALSGDCFVCVWIYQTENMCYFVCFSRVVNYVGLLSRIRWFLCRAKHWSLYIRMWLFCIVIFYFIPLWVYSVELCSHLSCVCSCSDLLYIFSGICGCASYCNATYLPYEPDISIPALVSYHPSQHHILTILSYVLSICRHLPKPKGHENHSMAVRYTRYAHLLVCQEDTSRSMPHYQHRPENTGEDHEQRSIGLERLVLTGSQPGRSLG